MFEAEFTCNCEFKFIEHFLETEITLAVDLDNFYVRCPRCGEQASPRSVHLAPEKLSRRRDWS